MTCMLAGVALMSTVGAPASLGASKDDLEYDATHIVVLEPEADRASVAESNGIEVIVAYTHIFNGFAGVVPEGRLEGLENDPRVAAVEANMVYQLLEQVVPTGVRRIVADFNPTARIDGADERVEVVVGVLDSGVQGDHPDLNVNVDKSVDCTTIGPCRTGVAHDIIGHGTHVAGTIGALDNGIGVVGVAPGAEIWSIKVCSAGCKLDHILKGHDYVSANADSIPVINVSLGGLGWSESWHTAIKDNVEKGVVVVVAAGNENTDIYGGDQTIGDGNETSPSSFPEAAAVSALADSDGKAGGNGPDTMFGVDDTLASFSNYSTAVVADNPVTSPGAAIDWAAPGVDILSTYKNSGYATLSGTSMAAPHGSGSVALYIAANGRAHDAAGVAATRQALIDGCQAMVDWRPGTVSIDSDPDSNHEGSAFVAPSPLLHDVAVTSISTLPLVIKGTPATVDVTLINIGAADETFDVTLMNLTSEVIIGTELVALAAGESKIVEFSWDTSSAIQGEHSLRADAVLATDEDTANNKMTTQVVIQSPFTDVVMTTVSVPPSAILGDVVGLESKVENGGNLGVTTDVLVTLRDATDDVTIGQQVIMGGLPVGSLVTLTFSWDTSGATLGRHLLIASHNLVDDDGTNNSLSNTLTLRSPSTTLNVVVVTDKEFLKNRDKVRITATVTDGINPVEGASVHVDVRTSNGNRLAEVGTTDKKGRAEFRMRVDARDDGCGTYTVNAIAFKHDFKSGSGFDTYNVAC